MDKQQIRSFITALILSAGICLGSAAQNLEQSYLDTLGDEPLLTLFDKHYGDSTVQEKIARTYLDRARTQKDTIKMARGFDRLARIFHPEKNIRYADSVIEISKNQNHKFYPTNGYFLKASNYKKLDNFNDFFANMKIGYDLAVESNNYTLKNYSFNRLIFYKAVWGDSKEALNLQREAHKLILTKFYKEKRRTESRTSNYLDINSLLNLDLCYSYQNFAHCFVNLKKLDSAEYYNEKLFTISRIYSSPLSKSFVAWSSVAKLEIDYYSGKYLNVIDQSKMLLNNDTIIKMGYLTDILIFDGLSQYEVANKVEAVSILKKIDTLFVNQGKKDFFPHERLVYEKLIDNSKSTGDFNKQLEYLEKIIFVDSILKSRYSFFDSKMLSEFETPKLLAEKQLLIDRLKRESQEPDPKFFITLSALTASLCLLFFYIRKRLVYKKRFEKLLAQRNTKSVVSLYENPAQNELSTEVVEDILEKLDRFERQHKYLDAEITLQSLAKKFKTNSNYLSRVINLKLEKNFSQYLHELRIAYAVDELFTNKSYRKYTIKAIAEECGYKNAESFSKAFYKLHGIYPSYYLKKLEKNVV